MSAEENQPGRRSTDADLAALAEWRKGVDTMLDLIHKQTTKTNGDVSELKVKERVRQDREEQKAIRDAASEAAKYRIEQKERDDLAQAEERLYQRITWKMMAAAACLGAFPGAVIEGLRLIFTGHL